MRTAKIGPDLRLDLQASVSQSFDLRTMSGECRNTRRDGSTLLENPRFAAKSKKTFNQKLS